MWAGSANPSRPQRRVLVVEDEPAIRLLVGDFLEGEGYFVQTAQTGGEALAAIRRLQPDALLLDIDLPDMNGWAVLSACRAMPGCGDLTVVIMSATPARGRPDSDLGVLYTVDKPFDLDRLASLLERVLREQRTCSVCKADAGTHELDVFEVAVRATVAWQLCGSCWHLLESGFESLRPLDQIVSFLSRPGRSITNVELRGFISVGLSNARRGSA